MKEPHSCTIHLDTNSRDFWDLAQNWIQSCLTHVACNGSYPPRDGEGSRFVPSRLLSIGSKPSRTARLIDKTDLPVYESVKYTALSHCWGGQISQQLLTINITSLKRSIVVKDLPRNFQDAILITQKLGYHYLWIDSLCIIQDCQVDWMREAASMGRIYANAQCTISATAASDSTGGCFFARKGFSDDNVCILRKQRDFLLVAEPSHTQGDPGGDTYDDQVAVVLEQQNTVLDELFSKYVTESPLAGRGWAFQERLLSRRILHFCDGSVLFECNTLRASDHHQRGVRYAQSAHLLPNGTLRHKELAKIAREQELQRQRDLERGSPYKSVKKDALARVSAVGGHVSVRPSEEISKLVPNPDYTGPPPRIQVVRMEPGPVTMVGPIFVPGALRPVKRTVANPEYEAEVNGMRRLAARRRKLSKSAALRGMRGTFQMLLNIADHRSWEEMVEFHDSWYEIIQQSSRYSRRSRLHSREREPQICRRYVGVVPSDEFAMER